MRNPAPQTIGLAAIATVTLFAACANWIYHSAVLSKLERIEREEESHMISTEWISRGKKRIWTSAWKEHDPEETFAVFLQRHKAEVTSAMAVFPEDVTGAGPAPAGSLGD